ARGDAITVWSLCRVLGFSAVVVAGTGGSIAQDFSQKADRPTSNSRPAERGGANRGRGPHRVPDELRVAHGLLRERRFDLAAEEYHRYLRTGPQGLDRIDAQFGLANARLYQGRYGDARRAFEEFLNGALDDPRALTARYRLGELSYLASDLPAAQR